MQKPMLFGLAVFLMVAFGVPWDDWFGGRARRGGQMTGKEAFMKIDDREYSVKDWQEFAFRWGTLIINKESADRENQLQRHFVLLQEAKTAGLQASAEQLRQTVRTIPMLRQHVVVEIVQAKDEALRSKVKISPEEIEAYFEQHKEDYRLPAEEGDEPGYKDLKDVSATIEKLLTDDKASKMVDEALTAARKKAEEGGKLTYRALYEVAKELGLDYSDKNFYDDQSSISKELGVLASNEQLAKKSFADPIGVVYGPFPAQNGPYIFRVIGRTAGFNAKKEFREKQEGWVQEASNYGTIETLDYAKLLSQVVRQMKPAEFEKTVMEFLLVQRYQEIFAKIAASTSDVARQSYMNREEQTKIGVLSLDASTFHNTVGELPEKDIKEFYNKYKDRPAPEQDGPGYLQPAMVTVEYVVAEKPDPAKSNLTDEQLMAYFEAKKDRYAKNPEAQKPEYPAFSEVKEQVKMDLLDEQFDEKVVKLNELSEKAAAALLADGASEMAAMAARSGLRHDTTTLRQDGRDIYKLGDDFTRDGGEVLKNMFDPAYLTEADLKSDDAAAREQKNAVSKVFELQSGSQYCFRVVELKPMEEVAFKDISQIVRSQVTRHLRTQRALDLAAAEAGKLSAIVRADAFDSLAKELERTPQATGEFKKGEYPAEFPATSAVGKAAAKLQPGEISGVVEDGAKLHVILCTGADEMLVWNVLTFPKDQPVAGPEFSDEELAEHLGKNVETFAEDLPAKGTAYISYVAAVTKDIEGSITLTEAEVKDYYEKNKDDEFDGMTLDECKADVEAALKAGKAAAKGEELLMKAFEEAKKNKDQQFDKIVKDTPLTQKAWEHISLEKAADVAFVGKAENLVRVILSTKDKELAGPVAAEEGSFFFRLEYRSLGNMAEVWKDLPEETREKVKADKAAKAAEAKFTPVEAAQLQLARYAELAVKNAPENHMIKITDKVKPFTEVGKSLSFSDDGRFTRETIGKLFEMEAGALSDPIVENQQALIFHVKDVQPKDMANVEYIMLSPEDFSQTNDWQKDQEEGKKLMEAALPKLVAAAKKADTLKTALKEVQAKLGSVRPLFARDKRVTRSDRELKKVFNFEPGQVGDFKEGRSVYVARLIDVVPCKEALVKVVQVYASDLSAPDDTAEQSAAKAEEAMTALRESAIAEGSFDKALEELKKLVTSQREIKVNDTGRYFNQATELFGVAKSKALIEAIMAANAGEFTEVIKDGVMYSVALVEDVRSDAVTADVIRLQGSFFADPNSITKDEMLEYYEENKEDYRREESVKVDYLSVSTEPFRADAEKAATDEALAEYFENNKAKWQYPDPDGNMQEARFDEVKPLVKTDFISEKAAKDAKDALAAVREAMEKEDADLNALANEKLQFNSLGLLTEKEMQNRLPGLPNLAQIAFAMDKGEVSDIVGGGTDFYLLKVTEEKESHIRDFKEVEGQVRRKIDGERCTARAEEAAKVLKEKVQKQLAAGKTLEEAVGQVPFVRHGKATYRSIERGFSRQSRSVFGDRRETPKMVKTAFALERGHVSQPIREDEEQQAVHVMVVRERVTPAPLTEKTLKDQRRTMNYMIQNELFESHVRQLLSRTKFMFSN